MIQREKVVEALKNINWNFSDYNSTKYPLDINSIPWYPATFIPPIPKCLIALLTRPGQVVLDPFGGKGTTAVETVKQNRIPIYNDLNPFAAEVTQAIFHAMIICLEDSGALNSEEDELEQSVLKLDELESFVYEHGISKDVFEWYDHNTLCEILSIVNMMNKSSDCNVPIYFVRKLALSSILKQASSQPGHFTYITDNCKPGMLVYKNAKKMYLERVQQIVLAVQDMNKQYLLTNPDRQLSSIAQTAKIVAGDARNLDWVKNESVNLVLTSPPYLCAQDYIKTMRLIHLFFPNPEGFNNTVKNEIGSRSKRRSKPNIVVPNFYADMNAVFSQIRRILSPEGYFCLIIGQGKAKITEGYDTIGDLCDDLVDKHGFIEIYHADRKISSRVIQVGGVAKEDIIVFQKKR